MRRQPKTDLTLEPTVVGGIEWFRRQLAAWFVLHGRSFPWREPGRSQYEILVAEILLQRTTAARVAAEFHNFIKQYPSWGALAQASSEDLQAFLRPLGLWQQRAQVLQALACTVLARGGSLPRSRMELEHLPGVGQYIASAVLVTLHEKAEPLIDVNMARVLERFFGQRKLADIRDDPYLQTLARRVVEGNDSLAINWAILDFGALVCTAIRPSCESCPISARCKYYALEAQP